MIYPFNSPEFLEVWKLWKQYKKSEHGFSYKSPVSEQAALKKISKLASTEIEAIAIIEQSIENGWKGLFSLNENGKTKNFVKYAAEKLQDDPDFNAL